MTSTGAPRRYLGMEPGDLDGQPYARYWNPRMAPLAEPVRQALANGPVAPPLLPSLDDSPRELESGREGLADGYCLARGGAIHVAISTPLPQVLPAMIDWWFGWHSEQPQRYKLWHPRAHVHAAWQSAGDGGGTGRARYVGRTSCVDEYIGSTLGSYAIRFLRPGELGFSEALLADPGQATAVCARVGFEGTPLDFGYLAHYVTRTDEGAVMRSRFWIGGAYAGARRGGALGNLAVRAATRFMRPGAEDASALLVHCAQEMSHLATFLPRLYADLEGAE